MFMGSVPIEENASCLKVKSVFCFAVAPEMQRKGIGRRLLERVCEDAVKDGFDYVEAYPNKEFINEEDDFMGPVELFRQSGFSVYHETEQKLVMRKQLSA